MPIVSLVVKGNFSKTSKSLKILLNWLQVSFSVDNRLRSTSQKRTEYVLRMSWRCVNNNSLTWWYDLKTSWRSLEDIFPRRLEDILKMSWRNFEKVLKAYHQDEYICLDQDVLKTSWRRLLKTYDKGEYIPLHQDVFKTSSNRLHQDECLLGLKVCEFFLFRHSKKTCMRFGLREPFSHIYLEKRVANRCYLLEI